MKPPPPMPHENGSVTPSTAAAVTAASVALPPRRSVSIAACVASRSTVAAAPPLPTAVAVAGGKGVVAAARATGAVADSAATTAIVAIKALRCMDDLCPQRDRAKPGRGYARPMRVAVEFEERYWYPDDGSIVWLSGYAARRRGRPLLARDAPQLAERGLRVAGVAGAARHHAAALESDAVAPGSALGCDATRPTSTTPTRSPSTRRAASRSAGCRASWRPRSRRELDAGTEWSALALRESRRSPRDPRTGLTMLLARAPAIELDVRERGRRA